MNYLNIFKCRAGRALAVTALCLFLFSAARTQGIKIHQLGLGDGDCSLIEIVDYRPGFQTPTLDTAVILIDAQRNSGVAASEIVKFINGRLGLFGLNRKVIDYVVLSHVHIDHYGNMVDVLTELAKSGYTVSHIFDRLALNISNVNWNLDDVDECYEELETGRLSASASAYNKFVRTNFSGAYGVITPGLDMLEGRFINTRMLCVAGYGAALNTGSTSPLFFIPWKSSAYRPKSENDLSFAFLMSYGGFRYFTGGDLGGQTKSTYANGELPIAQYLQAKAGTDFHFCSFKVGHHGSKESTSDEFLAIVKPTLAVIPASLRHYGRSRNPLPTCGPLTSLTKVGSKLAFTFVPRGDTNNIDNYCAYQNLRQTQDVTITINATDVRAAITMHLAFQKRDANYAITGPAVYQDLTCTQKHTGKPFSPTAMMLRTPPKAVIMGLGGTPPAEEPYALKTVQEPDRVEELNQQQQARQAISVLEHQSPKSEKQRKQKKLQHH